MKKNLIVGLLISALLVYFSLKDIDMGSVAEAFKSVRYGYAFLTLFCLFLIQALRSYRWGLLLAPFDKIGQFDLFAVTSVGFLAVVAIPARLGELARPYLIAGKSNVSMAVALGTVFVGAHLRHSHRSRRLFPVAPVHPPAPLADKGRHVIPARGTGGAGVSAFRGFQERGSGPSVDPGFSTVS